MIHHIIILVLYLLMGFCVSVVIAWAVGTLIRWGRGGARDDAAEWRGL